MLKIRVSRIFKVVFKGVETHLMSMLGRQDSRKGKTMRRRIWYLLIDHSQEFSKQAILTEFCFEVKHGERTSIFSVKKFRVLTIFVVLGRVRCSLNLIICHRIGQKIHSPDL
jgi:hypothetical protein